MKRMILQTLKLDMAMLDVSFSRGPRALSNSLGSGRRVLKNAIPTKLAGEKRAHLEGQVTARSAVPASQQPYRIDGESWQATARSTVPAKY